MIRNNPALGLDPRVKTGFPKRPCSIKMPERQSIRSATIVLSLRIRKSLPAGLIGQQQVRPAARRAGSIGIAGFRQAINNICNCVIFVDRAMIELVLGQAPSSR
jgi:hypothetical protein